jgi:subtilisin family serine protease
MARKLIRVGVLALVLGVPASGDAAIHRAHDADRRFVAGEALVRYAAGTDAAERRELRNAASVAFEQSLLLPRTQLVKFKGSVGDAIERLEDQPGVVDAQPNYVYHALAAAPNDTHFGHLWGLGATPGAAVLPAWDRSRGAGQVIAIVDTGVDLTHPDLAGNLWTGPGGVHGHDFVAGDDNPDDFNMHGTHVAGTAAAIAGNGQGVAGVAPQAQIMAVRVLDGDGLGSTSAIANGIVFAANNGAGVINLSLGGPAGPGDEAMSDAISQAAARNAVVVAAAGNESSNNDAIPNTPCTFPQQNLICVAAVTRTGARSGFSNFGATTVDLGAAGGDGSGDPDGDVLSAKPGWVTRFSEDFEGAFPGSWSQFPPGGTWGLANLLPSGHAVTDSPAGNYAANTSSMLQRTDVVDLSGGRGCRFDFLLGLDIDDAGDFVTVGLVAGSDELSGDFAGNTSGGLEFVEASLDGTSMAGRTGVRPTLRFTSNGTVQDDGAYVDDMHIACRDQSYDNGIGGANPADGGSYTAIAGTSMAAPHVAGVAALARAVDPGAPASQIVEALRRGAKPVSGMAGVTVSGGVVDAVGAMNAALGIANPQPPSPPPPPPQPQPPPKPRVGKVSFNARRGVLTMVVRGVPDVTGVVTLKANIMAARVRVAGRRAFAIGTRRRATVRIKLRKPAMRQLRRRRKLRLRSRVAIKNSAGLRASTTGTIRLRVRRR